MQTPREVIQQLFRADRPERVGLRDSPWSDTLAKWVGQGYPTDEQGNPVKPADHFGFDMVGVGSLPWKARLEDETIVEETGEWKIVRDGNGASFKWWKNKSGTPEHVDFEMKNREIWERDYKPYVAGSARRRATPEALKNIGAGIQTVHGQGKWADLGFRGLWENMRGAFGDLALYENMLLDPEWIRDYCRTYADLYRDELEIILAEAGRPDGVWFFDDLGYRGATFCAPRLYGELIFPFYIELVDQVHRCGMPAILHTCGYTESVLGLIAEVGFDGLHPMEVKAGNDPLRMAEGYADKLVFIGGLDARILESGDRELIEKEVGGYIDGMKARGARLVFGSDHSLSTNIDYGDFRFALEVYRKRQGY
jgi:uroporphyrinogen decarboxylase